LLLAQHLRDRVEVGCRRGELVLALARPDGAGVRKGWHGGAAGRQRPLRPGARWPSRNWSPGVKVAGTNSLFPSIANKPNDWQKSTGFDQGSLAIAMTPNGTKSQAKQATVVPDDWSSHLRRKPVEGCLAGLALMPGNFKVEWLWVVIPRVMGVLPCVQDRRSTAPDAHEQLETRVKAAAIRQLLPLVPIQGDHQDEPSIDHCPGVPSSDRIEGCEKVTSLGDKGLLFRVRLALMRKDGERKPVSRINLISLVQFVRRSHNCCQNCWQTACRWRPRPPGRLEMNSKIGGPGWDRTNDQPIMSRPL
ncbi:MAG: hypothetical protein QOJ10_831, partial [Chloroflexota bacterium]|nr:hypothetical protein [Chloroflexota bacterium]